MTELTIQEFFDFCAKELALNWITGQEGREKSVKVAEINRPGLALAGYFEFFRPERIQIFGQGECAYLRTLDNARRLEMLERIISAPDLPAIVLTHGRDPLPEIKELSNKYNVPIFKTNLSTAILVRELGAYLENRLAPMMSVHGVLTVVYGLGALIIGDSGIGKSECGLELVKRGHILVADDLVEIRRHPGDILIGASGPSLKHYMEVRGVGIIDVKQIFGVSSVKDSTRIELVVRLEHEKDNDEFDRLGMEDQVIDYLGVNLPRVDLPLRPGRNVAVLLEVAALNERLKQEGIYSARELNRKLLAQMNDARKSDI